MDRTYAQKSYNLDGIVRANAIRPYLYILRLFLTCILFHPNDAVFAVSIFNGNIDNSGRLAAEV
jgi:hypothetical protein